ncbi:hypothetical protein [Arthrobacter celericrescens]|uniref:hypothetical protein n=1 Tax=Arthrobacter celericrescens TaxID=2320851 RepID=UPI000EA3E40E|nr:hypothetical protein [Arthrobacter celericrescens]
MDETEKLDATFRDAILLLQERNIPVVTAQATVGAKSDVLWLDYELEGDFIGNLARTLDACPPRLVAACRAVDGDDEECSLLLIGSPSIGIRFGIPIDAEDDDHEVIGNDVDPSFRVEAESRATRLLDRISDRITGGGPRIEPSERGKIRLQVEQDLKAVPDADPLTLQIATERSFLAVEQITTELTRLHRLEFSDRAHEIAADILRERPNASKMNATALRPIVFDHLRKLDRECATQRSGEPVIRAILQAAKAAVPELF